MSSLCDHCKKPLPTSGDYVKCFNCKANYHYSPCTTIIKKTHDSMNPEKRAEWKCQNCRKSKSPIPTVVLEDTSQQKQQRDDDDTNAYNDENAKRFKDSLSLNMLNSKLCSVQSDVNEIKTTIQTIATNVNTSHLQIKEEIHNALATITNTLANLATQVSDLHDKNTENSKQISEMDKRINKLEQQAINKNIEINNIQNKEMSAVEVVKKIAASLTIDLEQHDISNAYRLRNNENKIVVEFSTLNKKRELMSKIRGHRIEANILYEDESNNANNNSNNNYVYVNDQLTANNRRLLWLTKIKAKECNWKFVWVKNGNIFARKIENSPAIIINNAADIESINQTS